ncbi:hypothetical protein [Pantoea cypripedii]|uniref:hypothetical protein n=1 Tax=Pantoea cypripedii TaxID=55209 RepID=UPI001ABEF588|nr:hypothetical protein [Pantoea cypripedii]
MIWNCNNQQGKGRVDEMKETVKGYTLKMRTKSAEIIITLLAGEFTAERRNEGRQPPP